MSLVSTMAFAFVLAFGIAFIFGTWVALIAMVAPGVGFAAFLLSGDTDDLAWLLMIALAHGCLWVVGASAGGELDRRTTDSRYPTA